MCDRRLLRATSCALLLLPSPLLAESPKPPETAAQNAILIEAATGDTLMAKAADLPRPTSSMSKVLTVYLVFEALRDGKLKEDDLLTVSERAWKQEGSRMFLNPGEKVRVADLIRGVIIQSGNDAAVVLAEALGGTEKGFAGLMNAKAATLGLRNAHFANATGLPDPQHYATAEDLAMLGQAMIRDFPEHYKLYSEKSFTWNGVTQGNRNPLLYREMGADGIKTGHTAEAGYGLMASVLRDGRRLVLVVNGLRNMQERADESARLLDWGFREYGLYPLLKAGQEAGRAKVWLGTRTTVGVAPKDPLVLSLPRTDRKDLKIVLKWTEPLAAPVAKGAVVGEALVTLPGHEEPRSVPLIASADVPEASFWDRLVAKGRYLLGKTAEES